MAQSFSLEGEAPRNLAENQEPPQSMTMNQEQDTKRRSLPLSHPKTGAGHNGAEEGDEAKGKSSLRDQEPTILTAKDRQEDDEEDESRFVEDDATRHLPGAS